MKPIKTPNVYPRASLHITAELAREIGGRDAPSASVRVFCEYSIAARQDARRELAGVFSVNELLAITDTLNGTLIEPAVLPYLHHEIREALDNGLTEKWNNEALVNGLTEKWNIGVGLLDRVRALSFVARWVLAEVVTARDSPRDAPGFVAAGITPGEGA